MHRAISALIGCAWIVLATGLRADAPAVKADVFASGIDQPCAIAVHAATGQLYAASASGEIFKIDSEGKSTVVVTGLPQSEKIAATRVAGRYGLAVADDGVVIVAALEDAGYTVRRFDLSNITGPVSADKAAQTVALSRDVAATGKDQPACSVALTSLALFVTANGDKDWMLRADIKSDHSFEGLEQSIRLEDTAAGSPIALTNKRELLALALTKKGSEQDVSQLVFYDGRMGRLLMSVDTPLGEIIGLAYNSTGSRLYAITRAGTASPAALYRLDAATIDGRPAVNAVKLIELDQPTALAFADDATLHVTALHAPGKSTGAGVVLKVTGEL